MRLVFILFTVTLLACNNAKISYEEVRKLKTIDTETFNKVLRREHDLAMEGMEVIKRVDEDTAVAARLFVINDEIQNWQDLVKEKSPVGFQPSEEQLKMFQKVLEFQEAYVNQMRRTMNIGE